MGLLYELSILRHCSGEIYISMGKWNVGSFHLACLSCKDKLLDITVEHETCLQFPSMVDLNMC